MARDAGGLGVSGILVAAGFLVMGLVSMPIATWFFLGALTLRCSVALQERKKRQVA
jgi:hypothetical protein